MNEHKKHNITLYATLAVAIIALIVGAVGLLRSGKSDTQTPGSSTPSSSHLAPPPGANVQTLPSGPNLNSSGAVGQ